MLFGGGSSELCGLEGGGCGLPLSKGRGAVEGGWVDGWVMFSLARAVESWVSRRAISSLMLCSSALVDIELLFAQRLELRSGRGLRSANFPAGRGFEQDF